MFNVALLASVSLLLLVGTTFTIPDENDASQSLLLALLRLPFVEKDEVGSCWGDTGVCVGDGWSKSTSEVVPLGDIGGVCFGEIDGRREAERPTTLVGDDSSLLVGWFS